MYNQFFGFKEKPFKLVPNPEYLYLSRIHEEVLAHLNYAADDGEGFVGITGEIGTGKTTLCRMFLENLAENTEAAYIFNPKLDALQLLKAINDEFGISSDGESIKTLIDRFNRFLLEKKVENKQVILLVDEAQNLSADVLEQLRLLSNLETTTSKLLQIILVGQPELAEMLESDRLRQLNQRISLSCHLVPLSKVETREYIRHRIHIASRKPGLVFTPIACRAIFKYSKGVPRLINIACDRTLLTAYSKGTHSITYAIVKRALGELDNQPNRIRIKRFNWEKWIVGLLAVLVVLVLGMIAGQIWTGWSDKRSETSAWMDFTGKSTNPSIGSVEPGVRNEPGPALARLSPPPRQLGDIPSEISAAELVTKKIFGGIEQVMASTDTMSSRASAMTAVLQLWTGKETPVVGTMDGVNNDTFFQIATRRNAMESLRLQGDLNMVRALNLPAILEFPHLAENGPVFMAFLGFEGENLRFENNGDSFSVPSSSLAGLWNGVAYIPWKNFYNYTGIIPISSPGEVIVSLKVHLRRLGFPMKEMNPAYDSLTRLAVETIQRRNGLDVDGMVGPMTKIVLYNEDQSLSTPHLTSMSQE